MTPSVEPHPSSAGSVRTLEGGLQVQDISEGSGAEATSGATVSVQYTGWHLVQEQDGSFRKGESFDSSVGRGKPFTFVLGSGSVIRGWDIGLAGMRVGGRRLLVIPPALAYGARGAGDVIRPNEALLFEVELVSVDVGSSRK
ncbi:MAG: FKBP-type peptidyl-prolyl cis-trans isomerase [Candidatus Yanofskybacteria bacterium]|nr:FKBP-type peptidyl-prolyl cis-trans isomerase [Candidatus Yanofskybacteria bacterium]